MSGAAKLAYVVPTMDRPDDLRALLRSLESQTRKPDQVVIVDASDPPIDKVLAPFESLRLVYVREFPPSLARQRNAGMAALDDDIEIAGYLDDDLILEPAATARMAAFWDAAAADVGGAAFNILNQPEAEGGPVTRAFLMNGRRPGQMLPSGWPSQIPTVAKTLRTDWLYGGATMWRREVIREFEYDEWFIGHGYGEDVEFSYRVGKKFELYVVAEAQVLHMTRPIRLTSQHTLGRQQVVNRLYFIRKAGGFPAVIVGWAMFGQLAVNLGASIFRFDSAGARRFAGNLAGLGEVMRGGVRQIGNYYK